jgi:hypothetical protein
MDKAPFSKDLFAFLFNSIHHFQNFQNITINPVAVDDHLHFIGGLLFH